MVMTVTVFVLGKRHIALLLTTHVGNMANDFGDMLLLTLYILRVKHLLQIALEISLQL